MQVTKQALFLPKIEKLYCFACSVDAWSGEGEQNLKLCPKSECKVPKTSLKIFFKKVAANRKRSTFLSTKCNNISEIEEDTYKLTKASRFIAHMCFCVECSNRIKYFSHIGKIATTGRILAGKCSTAKYNNYQVLQGRFEGQPS